MMHEHSGSSPRSRSRSPHLQCDKSASEDDAQREDDSDGVSVDSVVWQEQTDLQELLVFQSQHFGLCLALDGVLQSTEHDEHIYHEFLAHVPLCLHPAPRRVLVCGGGNGAAAREALRHTSVEKIVIAEIDAAVVAMARKWLPLQSGALDDPRAEVRIADAAALLAAVRREGNQGAPLDEVGSFDVILVDGTDGGLTSGHSDRLLDTAFYRACHARLRQGGLLATQLGACIPSDEGGLAWSEAAPSAMDRLRRAFFSDVAGYCVEVPSYGGLALFALACSTGRLSAPGADAIQERITGRNLTLRAYSARSHAAAFQLPAPLRAACSSGATSEAVLDVDD